MTGPHLEPEAIVAYADGSLAAAESAAVSAHVAVCPDCRGQLEDLCRLENLVNDAGETDEDEAEPTLPPEIERAYGSLIQTHVLGRGSRFGSWRKIGMGISAAAAAIALWVVLRPDPPAKLPLIRGAAVFEHGTGVMRGAGEARLHFEIAADRATHLAIFQVAGSSVELLYPHPNPAFGAFGRTAPLQAEEQVRIPPTPVADYPEPATRPAPVFLAVPLPELPTAYGLAQVLEELRAVAPSGVLAVRAKLEARFGSAAELPARRN
jgi:Putative zinc-finger